MRFTQVQRLKVSKQFDKVFQAPKKLRSPHFSIFSRSNDCGHPRLGLVVGKKRIRTAVRRNLCKRIIRESYRRWCDRLPGHDIVVVAQSRASEGTSKQLHDAIDTLWLKLSKQS